MRCLTHHGTRQLPASEARKQLALMLAGCTDQALAGFTVEGLVATHRISARHAEQALRYARERRLPEPWIDHDAGVRVIPQADGSFQYEMWP